MLENICALTLNTGSKIQKIEYILIVLKINILELFLQYSKSFIYYDYMRAKNFIKISFTFVKSTCLRQKISLKWAKITY